MIGMKQRQHGRLGNYLFQVNFVMQLALATGTDFMLPAFKRDTTIRPKQRFSSGFLSAEAACLTEEFLMESDTDEILRETRRHLDLGKSIEVPVWSNPSESYLKVALRDPSELFRVGSSLAGGVLSKRLRAASPKKSEIQTVAMHFRGTDYHSWDATAVMPASYYMDALEMAREKFQIPIQSVALFTDDPESETARALSSLGIKINSRNFNRDFMSIMNSDLVIASPSTFSFWAALLGSKNIIFPMLWAERKAAAGSDFWTNALGNSLPFIDITCT